MKGNMETEDVEIWQNRKKNHCTLQETLSVHTRINAKKDKIYFLIARIACFVWQIFFSSVWILMVIPTKIIKNSEFKYVINRW